MGRRDEPSILYFGGKRERVNSSDKKLVHGGFRVKYRPGLFRI
jgi:hypothetical protein